MWTSGFWMTPYGARPNHLLQKALVYHLDCEYFACDWQTLGR